MHPYEVLKRPIVTEKSSRQSEPEDQKRYTFEVDRRANKLQVKEAVETACANIFQAAQNDPRLAGMGTTTIALLVRGNEAYFAHVGDSRGYLIRGGHATQITRDHSLVQRLEELGQITSAEAAVHPQRNVLYRALGQGETLEPDVVTTPFPVGGYLLLCSDGLWGVVPEDEIRKIIYEAPTIQRACQNLVSAANAAGGPDNISTVLVQLLA